VGERHHELKTLLDDYKFNRAYALHRALAELLHTRLPRLPEDTVVVPLPTVARHKRIRGYDHIGLIAKTLASKRGLANQAVLGRRTNSVQLGANSQQRRRQADQAYCCNGKLDPAVPYLLVDDIVTTGATMRAAARCLKAAGAKIILIGAIARQA